MVENDKNNAVMIESMKRIRKEMELSQEKFAEFLGVARNTVARWENGRLKIPRYIELLLLAISAISSKQFQMTIETRDAVMELAKQQERPDIPKDAEFYNKSDLKKRGWTDAMIRDFIKADIQYGATCAAGQPNFNYKYFYLVSNVEAIEETEAFKKRKRS